MALPSPNRCTAGMTRRVGKAMASGSQRQGCRRGHFAITRVKLAVIMRIASPSLPQRAWHFSDGGGRVYRSGPPAEPRRAVCALLKTRHQLPALVEALPLLA